MPNATERKLHKLLTAICATGQADVIEATDVLLRVLLNGGAALRHSRMFPSSAAETIAEVLLLTKDSVKPKRGRRQ